MLKDESESYFFPSSHFRNVVSSYSDIQVRVVQLYFYFLISLLKAKFHGREEKGLQVAQHSDVSADVKVQQAPVLCLGAEQTRTSIMLLI